MYKFYYTNGYGVTSYIRKPATSLWQTAWNPNIRKWLMRINLTCLMLLIAFMQVSLAANAQKISLSKRNAPLTEIFKELRKQSGYDFVINKDQIKIAKPVTILVNGDDLINVLNKCFEGQPFTYSMEDKMIIVVNKQAEKVRVNILPIDISGKVLDEKGEPISGASVKVKGTNLSSATDKDGIFIIKNVPEDAVLEVYYLGYKPKEVKVSKEIGNISLEVFVGELREVNVVSTGYQNISKERVTGSVTTIDSALLNRKVGTSILDRLDGVTSGLIFNRNQRGSDFTIRGRSTINGEDRPLIIVDNFPYEGNIENINPNDIKSINVLKDAASASIWGTRAGNGVVVITTFKGEYGKNQKISFNSNVTVGRKPNLSKLPWVSSDKWIEIERFLYEKGAYTSVINSGYAAISEAVEIFDQRKKQKISSADSLAMMNNLKGNDVRGNMLKYIYQPTLNQQYALNINGGGKQNKYFVSAGYDKNLSSKVTESYSRFTLTANNSYRTFSNRLEINTGLLFTTSFSGSGIDSYTPGSPYEKLADETGNPLAVRNYFRINYVDTAGNGKLLDWKYRPLNELSKGSSSDLTSYIINAGLNYSVVKGLKASVLYQYQKQLVQSKAEFDDESYYVRNFINSTSKINYSTGAVQRIIPLGDINRLTNTQLVSNYARFQLDYNTVISNKHEISALAGSEVRDNSSESFSQTLYGYNKSTRVNSNSAVDYTKDYPLYYVPSSTTRIETGQNSEYFLDRYVSLYANAMYSFKKKYFLTLSARRDESNLFGVKSNQKGVPLWSSGIAWDIGKEKFYNVDWLPYLKLRGSFGYSGNVSKSLSAYLTANAGGANLYGAQFNIIVNPPNPSLRWERVKTINLGIDFATKNNRISGSIEPYVKYGLDLFGTAPLAAQTGLLSYTGNFANTLTRGIDVTINTFNTIGSVRWSTNYLFSFNRDEVTKYSATEATNSSLILNTYANPIVGNPYFSVYAYKWAGLDNFGDPQVYFDGLPSKAYSNLANSKDRSNLRLMGSAVPTVYGSLRNTFGYKNFELSFNITYRLNYYFRRTSLDNSLIYTPNGFQSSIDYENRWQKPGDEKLTSVPALLYPNNSARATTYRYADILVERADNIRLQDIRIDWNINNINGRSKVFSDLRVYSYLNNIGCIWTANKHGIDPDNIATGFSNIPTPLMLAFGIKANF